MSNPGDKAEDGGLVRARSNVSLDGDAWELVPGDLIRQTRRWYPTLTQRQKDELMFYVPCANCGRDIFEIKQAGCDDPRCRSQGILSTAEAMLRNAKQ